MALFALSDLHLSLGTDKPMDVFGASWHNHTEKIRISWINTVKDDDLVIIGGDLSWATYLTEACEDFKFINSLPGKKLLIKGNHDYWWESVTKLKNYVHQMQFNSISFLHNNAYIFQNFSIAGTRGWLVPSSDGFSSEDKKIYERELIRLNLSLEEMQKLEETMPQKSFTRVAVLHYPPINSFGKCDEGILETLLKFGVKKCIYGHLHGVGINIGFTGNAAGIDFYLTSSDALGFTPLQIT